MIRPWLDELELAARLWRASALPRFQPNPERRAIVRAFAMRWQLMERPAQRIIARRARALDDATWNAAVADGLVVPRV